MEFKKVERASFSFAPSIAVDKEGIFGREEVQLWLGRYFASRLGEYLLEELCVCWGTCNRNQGA